MSDPDSYVWADNSLSNQFSLGEQSDQGLHFLQAASFGGMTPLDFDFF